MTYQLKSYEDLPAFEPDQLRARKEAAVAQDFLGPRPIYVSLVFPTIRVDDQAEFRNNILRHTLDEVDPLLTSGVVDEVLFVDGTHTDEGMDRSNVDEILGFAHDHLDLFREEVDLARSHGAVRSKLRQGALDTSVKVLHQWDEKVERLLQRLGVVEELPMGKGAALWLASVAARGDVVIFVDSDIRNFSSHFALNLLGPILDGWDNRGGTSHTKYVKGYYHRLGTRLVGGEHSAYLGGRVTRLLVKPLFTTLANEGLFRGLDEFQYPLSGEYSATRDVLEGIEFANGYGVEVSTLCQVFQNWGIGSMAQANFVLFQHLSQSESNIEDMARDITSTLYTFIQKYYGHRRVEAVDLADRFVDEAHRLVKDYEAFVQEEADRSSIPILYDRDKELGRVDTYAEAIRAKPRDTVLLPRWRSQEDLPRIKRESRARAVQSTWESMERAGLV